MSSEIDSAVEHFLHLVWAPGEGDRDIGQLIQALDRLAYLAHGIEYEFDAADYPDPPDLPHSQHFAQAEAWLMGLRTGALKRDHAAVVDDLAGIIDDLEIIRWRFRHTSEADALREFELGFKTHWGHHLRTLQSALHDWYW